MRWVAPSEKDDANHQLEKRLWEAADQFRANSGLKAGEYSGPVLGLIFLRFAEARFAKRRAELEKAAKSSRRGSLVDRPDAYLSEGVLFLTPSARFDYLLARPEGSNVGKAVNEAMADIEKHNPNLKGVLPHNYQIFNGTLLKELLKKVSEIPVSLDFDAFGRIYEYFLGEFARSEGQKGACPRLASESAGSRRRAACDRGRARRGLAARLHERNLSDQVQRAVRARVRIVHG